MEVHHPLHFVHLLQEVAMENQPTKSVSWLDLRSNDADDLNIRSTSCRPPIIHVGNATYRAPSLWSEQQTHQNAPLEIVIALTCHFGCIG